MPDDIRGDEVRIDPHNTKHIIYMSEGTDLFESYDGGKNFERIANEFRGSKISTIQEGTDGTLYVANLGIGLSSQPVFFGQNWNHLRKSPDYSYVFRTHPTNPDVILAAQSPRIFEDYASIYQYNRQQMQDQGWREVQRFPGAAGITALEYGTNPQQVFAGVIGTPGKLFLSLDGGNRWDRFASAFTFTTIHAMVAGDQLYAAPWGDGLHLRKGDAWVKLPHAPFSVAVVRINPKNSQEIIAGDRTAPIIWRSQDGGITWEKAYTGDKTQYRVMALAYAEDPAYAYVSTMHRGAAMKGSLFKVHLDSGKAEDITNGLRYPLLDIATSPDGIYVSTHIPGVQLSKDGGASWTSLDYPGGGANDLLLDEKGTLYVASGCGAIPDQGIKDSVCGIYRYDGEWKLLKETKAQVKSIAQKGDLLVAAGAEGAWRSNDHGITWQLQNRGLDFKNSAQIAIIDDDVFIGTLGGGVYRSSLLTKELSWKSTGLESESKNIQLLIDQQQPTVLYTTSYPGGVFKSVDGGQTWNEANFGLPTFKVLDPLNQGYYTLAIDPDNSDILYLGLFGRGIYKSEDGAATWFPLYGDQGQNMDLMRKGITKVVTSSGAVYAASDDGVYVSTDGGENWKEMSQGLDTKDVRTLHLVEGKPEEFSEDFSEGLPPSGNFIGDWSVENGQLTNVGFAHVGYGPQGWSSFRHSIDVKRTDGAPMIVLRRENGERAIWVQVSENRVSLMKERGAPAEELAGADYDYGTAFHTIESVVDGYDYEISVDGVQLLSYDDSSDPIGPGSFELESSTKAYFDNINLVRRGSNVRLYAGTNGYGAYGWGGDNWEWFGNTMGGGYWDTWERRIYQFGSFRFDPDKEGVIYFGHFPGGFFTSEDAGKTWKDSSAGIGNDGLFSLYVNPHNHDELWAGSYNGVVKSSDRGRTWTMKSEGMPSEQWVYTVAFDPENPKIMYASSKNGQNKGFCERNTFCGVVVKSTDGGESWFKIMDGLPVKAEYYTLLFNPNDSDILFLSTSNGVYMTLNAGENWFGINEGLPSLYNGVRDNVAENLAITADDQYLLLALVNNGIWKANISDIK